MKDARPIRNIAFVAEHEQNGGDNHENSRRVNAHTKPAESLNFDGLNDDEQQSAKGTADNGEGNPKRPRRFAKDFPTRLCKKETRQKEK